jgi:hypothetical protein
MDPVSPCRSAVPSSRYVGTVPESPGKRRSSPIYAFQIEEFGKRGDSGRSVVNSLHVDLQRRFVINNVRRLDRLILTNDALKRTYQIHLDSDRLPGSTGDSAARRPARIMLLPIPTLLIEHAGGVAKLCIQQLNRSPLKTADRFNILATVGAPNRT